MRRRSAEVQEASIKRHFGSYRVIRLQLWTLVYLDIDYFFTEEVQRANSLMVVTEKINSQPKNSGGYGASVHGGGMRGRRLFELSEEQLSFLSNEQGFKVKNM